MRFSTKLWIVVMVPLALARVSLADTSSVACGYSNGLQINMPTGAVGLTIAGGPVQAVLNAVGEQRTHSFINHGNGWITHSTMLAPSSYGSGGTNGSDASMDLPVSPGQTQNGFPGSSQINMGALYSFYYAGGAGPSGNGSSATVGNVQAFYYQRGSTYVSNGVTYDRGNLVQQWLWNSSNYAWVGNDGIGGQGNGGFYRVGFNGTPYKQYSLYQYMDMENVATGGYTYNNGDVCSTTLAAAQYLSGQGQVNNSNYYTSAQITNGLNAEWWAVYNECQNSSAGWFDVFGVATYLYLCANGDCQTGASCCNDNGDWGCVFVGHSWCTYNHENSNKSHLCARRPTRSRTASLPATPAPATATARRTRT